MNLDQYGKPAFRIRVYQTKDSKSPEITSDNPNILDSYCAGAPFFNIYASVRRHGCIALISYLYRTEDTAATMVFQIVDRKNIKQDLLEATEDININLLNGNPLKLNYFYKVIVNHNFE